MDNKGLSHTANLVTETRPVASVPPFSREGDKSQSEIRAFNWNDNMESEANPQDNSNSDHDLVVESSAISSGSVTPTPFDDPASHEENVEAENLESPVEGFCDFQSLKSTAAAMFNEPRFTPPKVLWFSCVVFDVDILHELTTHEQQACQLFTSTGIGRLFSEKIKNEGHSWPGVAQMDWRKPFIVLDMISGNRMTAGQPGSRPCLRVREKEAADTQPRLWDLVIGKDCENLALEMGRLVDFDVKTTVIIWGARTHTFPKSWVEDVQGELFLMPTNKDDDVLSVIIFHHEDLTLERGKLIHGPFPDSELWHLQDPDLGYRTLIQVDIRGNPRRPTHLTLHTKNPYIPIEGLPPQVPPCPLVLFPEDGIPVSDDEDEFSDDDSSEIVRQFDEEESEEDWEDFVSVSRAASRAGSSSPENRIQNDLVECAERLFQKPKPFSFGTKAAQNLAGGESAKLMADIAGASTVSSSNDDSAENNRVPPARETESCGQKLLVQLEKTPNLEINTDKSQLPMVTNSEMRMLLTQDMIVGDSENDQVEEEKHDDDVTVVCVENPSRDNQTPQQPINPASFNENSGWYDFSEIIDQL